MDIFRSCAGIPGSQSYNNSSESVATTPNSKWKAIFASVYAGGSRTAVLTWSTVVITVIALIDRYFDENISFGFLYLFPMLMIGAWLRPWQLALVAALCTALTEAFDPFPWTIPVGVP